MASDGYRYALSPLLFSPLPQVHCKGISDHFMVGFYEPKITNSCVADLGNSLAIPAVLALHLAILNLLSARSELIKDI